MKSLLDSIIQFYHRVDQAYKRGFNNLFISCERMTELASQACEGKLPLRIRWRRRIHLCICTWCRRYEKQLRFLRNHMRHYADHYPDQSEDKLPNEVRKRIQSKIKSP